MKAGNFSLQKTTNTQEFTLEVNNGAQIVQITRQEEQNKFTLQDNL